VDLLAGMCTEAWSVQMRSFARGSDGLAEVTADDAAEVILPKISNKSTRKELRAFVDQLKKGHTSIKAAVEVMGHHQLLPVADRSAGHPTLCWSKRTGAEPAPGGGSR
jgi:type I restriction enzyme M protein